MKSDNFCHKRYLSLLYFVHCLQGGLILLVLVLLFKIAHKNVSRTLAVEIGGKITMMVPGIQYMAVE